MTTKVLQCVKARSGFLPTSFFIAQVAVFVSINDKNGRAHKKNNINDEDSTRCEREKVGKLNFADELLMKAFALRVAD